jgi:hypothetical protein
MQQKKLVKLALLVALLMLTLHIGTPRPAAALTCPQQCERDYIGCLHGCGLFCIGDDACYAACSADCDVNRSDCLSSC